MRGDTGYVLVNGQHDHEEASVLGEDQKRRSKAGIKPTCSTQKDCRQKIRTIQFIHFDILVIFPLIPLPLTLQLTVTRPYLH